MASGAIPNQEKADIAWEDFKKKTQALRKHMKKHPCDFNPFSPLLPIAAGYKSPKDYFRAGFEIGQMQKEKP